MDGITLWTIAVGMVAAASCAVLGCFLVLRRMSLLGDAISHAAIAGIALAYLLTGTRDAVPLMVGALAVGFVTTVLTQSLHGLGRVSEDSSMGIVFTSLFAFGALIVSRAHVDLDASCVLFGNLDFIALDRVTLWGVTFPRALQTLVPVCLATLAFTAVFWKELGIASFDPMLATAMGLSAAVIHYLLMGMVALVTVTSLEAVGAIVVIAMLIVPAAAAHLLTERMWSMVAVAAAIGMSSAALGWLAARRFDANGAGMIAVVMGLQFLAAVLLAPRHGLVAKAVGMWRLRVRIASEDLVAILFRIEERQAAGAAGLSSRECVRAAGGAWTGRRALAGARHRGLVAGAPGGGYRLTDRGRELGRTLVRSHRLWEAYLVQHFDLPPDHLHAPAERVEHYIGPALQDQLARELNRPDRDPHGSTIPPGTSSPPFGKGGPGGGARDA